MEESVSRFFNKISAEKTWNTTELDDLDDHYVFGKQFYCENKRIYEPINAQYILQTSVTLPFYVPLNDLPYTIPFFGLEEARGAITIIFSPIVESKVITGGFVQDHSHTYQRKRSRCELIVCFIDDSFAVKDRPPVAVSLLNVARYVRQAKDRNDPLDQDFVDATHLMFSSVRTVIDRSLELVSSIIMAYSEVQNDDSVFPVDIRHIEPVSHFRVIEPIQWTSYNWMSMNNLYWPNQHPPVVQSEIARRVYSHSFVNYGGAFEEFQKYYWRGRYELRLGETDLAVVYAVLSVEVLTSKIYVLYETATGRSVKEVTEELAEIPFKRILDREMPRMIGGSWDLSARRSAPGKLYLGAYHLRNQTVHFGRIPEHMDAISAMEQTDKLHQYIHRLVNRRPKRLRSIVEGFRSPFAPRR